MLKDIEPYLQLKGSNLWFGVVQGGDGSLEGVNGGHLRHMDWEVIPLHNCQGKEGVFIVVFGSGDLSIAIRVAASRNSSRLHKILGEGDCYMMVDNFEK